MRKSGLTGDEAYALSKHGKTTEDLDLLKKELDQLNDDLSEVIDTVLFHSSDVKDTTIVPINLKTGTKIRIRRKDGKDFTKNNQVKFWKEDGSTNITYFIIEPSFGKERVIVYTYADASYVSLNIADTDIVIDVYADDTLATIVKNQESIVSQVKNDIFYDFIDLIGTTRFVFPFVKNDTIIIERVDGKDFEGSNRLILYGEDNAYVDYYSLASSFGNKRVITYAKNNPVKYIALNSASTYAIRVTLQSNGKLIGQVADNTNRIIALETEIHATIADRFVSEMNETIASVRNCMTEPCLVFPKITDIHYAPTSTVFQNFDETIKNMKYFVERIHCDFIANLGDNINGSSSVDTSLSQADYMLSAFNGIGIPYLFAMGNHDTNYDPSPKFDIGQTYRSFVSATPKNAIINKNTNGTDFYLDYDELGIRIAFINTNYLGAYVLAEDTKTWFINTVLNTNKLVVLCEHMSTQANQNFSNKIPSATMSEAINNAISTFISNGGKFIQLFGHSHCDCAFTNPWLSIASTCGKFEQTDVNSESIRAITGYDTTYGLVSPSRTEGNATEQAWDVVVIRPTSRKINLIRFGAGVDREFSY